MTIVRFTPAASDGWLAIASGSRVLVVAPGVDDAFIASVWSVVGVLDGPQLVVDRLVAEGIDATPDFALLDWPGAGSSLRLIVRGGVRVTLTLPGGDETIDGARDRGNAPWFESTVPAVTAVTVTVSGAVAAESPALPLAAGAAWIASLQLESDATTVAPSAGDHSPAEQQQPAEPQQPAEQPPAIYDDEIGATQYRSVADAIVPLPPAAAPPAAAPPAAVPPTSTPPAAAMPTSPVATASVGEASVGAPPVGTASVGAPPVGVPPAEGDHDGQTVMVEPAAPGDHDGHTIVSTDIAALRGRAAAARPAASSPAPGAPVAVLLLSTGAREPLTQPILIGRAPSVSQVSGDAIPRLITVGGADQDISRTHARFSLEGGTVVVTDLHSRNGTTIAMPGKSAQKLRAGEPTTVIVGTVVDLGGGVTVTVTED